VELFPDVVLVSSCVCFIFIDVTVICGFLYLLQTFHSRENVVTVGSLCKDLLSAILYASITYYRILSLL